MVPLLTSDADTIKIDPNTFGADNLEPITALTGPSNLDPLQD